MTKTILIIEDEEEISTLLSMRLKAQGYDVLVADDGLAGLEKAREHKPDLIILDVGLPRLNGFEVCRMLKFDNQYKHIPILMLTARSQAQDKKIGHEVGADIYVPKPFDAQDLLKRIGDVLQK